MVSPLHIDGKYIKDSAGNIVRLRGVNVSFNASTAGGYFVGQYQIPYRGNWDEALIRENIQQMAGWGINLIRILTYAEWWINNADAKIARLFPGDETTSGIKLQDAIKRVIEIAAEYGIYVAVSWWGVVEDQVEHMPIPPYRNDPVGSATVFPTVQSWIDFEVDVATTLQIYDNFILELWGEPADGAAQQSVWFVACQQAIDAIRLAGVNNIIVVKWGFCGGLSWLKHNDLPTGTNILYNQHIYRYAGTFPNNEYTYADVYDILYNFREYSYAIENNIPLIVLETGCWKSITPAAEELEYWTNVLKILNEWQIGYAAFSWRPEWSWALVNNDFSPTPAGQVPIDLISAPPTPPIISWWQSLAWWQKALVIAGLVGTASGAVVYGYKKLKSRQS